MDIIQEQGGKWGSPRNNWLNDILFAASREVSFGYSDDFPFAFIFKASFEVFSEHGNNKL